MGSGDTRGASARSDLLRPGDTCWRLSEAARFALVIDGAAYFRALREALLQARRQVLLIGWDFDLEIDMLPTGDGDPPAPADGYPNRLGDFLEALVGAKPDLSIYLLRWTGATLIAPGRFAPVARLKLAGPERIRVALDGRHPPGACHHQKIVVVDDCFAFCGGIDATDARWDTCNHMPADPRRRLRDGSQARPWHDVTTALTGPVARDLGDLARIRWHRATDSELPVPEPEGDPIWPASLTPDCENVTAAIARTHPPEQDLPLINEIERLVLASIADARRFIYIESQYFASDEIAAALARRLAEPEGPDIIVLNPESAAGFVEDQAMHVTRDRLLGELAEADRHDRFRIWCPVNAAEDPIYVHAKVCVTDDRLLRVGSSNVNRRSLGFDTECDLALDGGDAGTRAVIAGLRNTLLAEHLNCSVDALEEALQAHDRPIAAVESLNGASGRHLRRLQPREDSGLGAVLADTRALDPRYDDGTTARRGITARHIAVAAVAVLALLVLLGFRL